MRAQNFDFTLLLLSSLLFLFYFYYKYLNFKTQEIGIYLILTNFFFILLDFSDLLIYFLIFIDSKYIDTLPSCEQYFHDMGF